MRWPDGRIFEAIPRFKVAIVLGYRLLDYDSSMKSHETDFIASLL